MACKLRGGVPVERGLAWITARLARWAKNKPKRFEHRHSIAGKRVRGGLPPTFGEPRHGFFRPLARTRILRRPPPLEPNPCCVNADVALCTSACPHSSSQGSSGPTSARRGSTNGQARRTMYSAAYSSSQSVAEIFVEGSPARLGSLLDDLVSCHDPAGEREIGVPTRRCGGSAVVGPTGSSLAPSATPHRPSAMDGRQGRVLPITCGASLSLRPRLDRPPPALWDR